MDKLTSLVVCALLLHVAPTLAAKIQAVMNLAAVESDAFCHGKSKSCSDDCSTIVSCTSISTGVWIGTGNTTCATATYCDDTTDAVTCVSTMPSKCAAPKPSKNFQCSGTGYFPDPTSCYRYYFCTAKLEAYLGDCLAYPGTLYDQRTTQCVPPSTTNACFRLTCAAAGNVQLYTPDPRVYFICRSTAVSEAVVAKCPDNQAMNVKTGVCSSACLQAGRLPGTDTHSYIECVNLGGNKLSAPTTRTCPPDSTFATASQQCVIAQTG